jgi:ComF family protein
MVNRVGAALLDALAVLSPIDCAGCGSPDRSLCAACRRDLEPAVTPRSLRDGIVVYTALRYEGVARQVLLALKESGRTDVARTLGATLAVAIDRAAAPGVEVVSVPTSRSAWRRRGYDPVALLCRKSGHVTSRVLVARRRTASQKTLGADDRQSNLRGSMAARGSLAGRRFILVDDVVTTGATLAEAARAISEAGGEVVAAAALAFTPRLSMAPVRA